MNEYLPLGSVVRLNSDPKKLVSIIGFCPTANDENYDYCGVLLPFGYIKTGVLLTFNHEDISEIVFKGYLDEKAQTFLELFSRFKDESESKNEK